MTNRRTPRGVLDAVERRLAKRLIGGASERDQWLRLAMYDHVDGFLRELGPAALDAVEISGCFYDALGWHGHEVLRYPEFDLCDPGEILRTFDVVICDQVLEHVIDPSAAMRTLSRLCAPGGHVVVGTPFLIKVHRAPEDYWRFTEAGLRVLVERAGLEVVELRSWGNRQCVRANLLTWARRHRFASMRNEADFPVNVWAIATRPADVVDAAAQA